MFVGLLEALLLFGYVRILRASLFCFAECRLIAKAVIL